jgi:hypothetical protein
MAEGKSKAHQRQQAKHQRSGKYVKQKERTFKNKLRKQLLNAARNSKPLLDLFLTEQGGWSKVYFIAQNDINKVGLIDSLAARANKKAA